MTRARALVSAFVGLLLTVPLAGGAQAQAATITGRVLSDAGSPLVGANVFITELNALSQTNNTGAYTINIPAARVTGQQVVLRVRAFGYLPETFAMTLRAGTQTHDFTLKQDVNRLSEVVVTGTVEGTERSKVPFAVGRLTTEDMPVPALDPIRALAGKVAGVRIAQTGGKPGSTPEIMMRGPTSIDASGRSQGPLIIVDGAIMNVGSLAELGGLDVESVEIVKGAAGASLYGTRAARGVINIKTKRGNSSDGVKFNVRSEMGFSDLNSLDYGQPVNHTLQLDETGKRFCILGGGLTSACSQTIDWMTEIMRMNNFPAPDSIRTNQITQYNNPALAGGQLTNVIQASIWPGQYYNTFAQLATRVPTMLNSVDASGRMAGVRFFVSGSYQDEGGAIKNLNGQQQRRGRVNLDYDVKNNMSVSVSTMYANGFNDNRDGPGFFGALLRGAVPGTDYLARDTVGCGALGPGHIAPNGTGIGGCGRGLIRGGGSGLRGSGNGGGTFLYEGENRVSDRKSERYLASMAINYFPTDWITMEAAGSYDNRHANTLGWTPKGYRTTSPSATTNLGNMSFSHGTDEAYNASVTTAMRKALTSDLNGKLSFRALYERQDQHDEDGSGSIFIVKDIYTVSNTSTSKSANSSSSSVRNMGLFTGATLDYKDRYILDGTFRYDGSSLFGAGNRWAPFGRISGVWRVSEEPFWNIGAVSDFRFRASRGTAGSTPRFTAQYETYSCGQTGCTLGQAGNTLLKPETTTETEIGTDFTLFDRLGVEITNANSSTKNQILPVPTPAVLGFRTQWQNAGTLANHTWEVGLNLPVITNRDLQWSMRGTWDRTRTFITELFRPEFFTSGGTGQGTGSLFLITADKSEVDGVPRNRYGTMYGRRWYRSCDELVSSAGFTAQTKFNVDGTVAKTKEQVIADSKKTATDLLARCGPGKEFQVNDEGWLVWTGQAGTYTKGITDNLWQTYLSAGQSPWGARLYYGHPILDRPFVGETGEGTAPQHVLGNALPSFRMTFNNTITYKRLSLYGLLDGTFGFKIQNQGEGWGLLDFASAQFDQSGKSVETAKPVGYSYRAVEGGGTGGFYDILGPNNYNTEDGSYVKLRELSLSYRVGKVGGLGDWTVGVLGRNMMTFTKYSGYDPETGVQGGSSNSGLINQVDAFDYPTLRTFTFTISTRF